MSPHVVPKAPAFSEDEKTTIEASWEEEVSTAVDQGQIAEKLRALAAGNPAPQPLPPVPPTHVTATNPSLLDEPTIDEQRAAALSLITPPAVLPRLLITAGNDRGQEIELQPHKTYTIGRAIDNDVVLTDIAVSRKHFDLRFENGAWLLADRGSGNGTLVNGTLEDQPFLLAHGDAIEIGNTGFRFDYPGGPSRPSRASTPRELMAYTPEPSPEVERDDDELSTVAGKPVREILAGQPRPKTAPPPPSRPAASAAPPHAGLPPLAVTPMSSLAPRPGPAVLAPQPEPPTAGTTLLGPVPYYTPPGRPASSPDLLIQSGIAGGVREVTHTAHVPPTPFNGVRAAPHPYVAPAISRRAKRVIGGVTLALLGAIATVAIVKGGDPSDDLIADEPAAPVPAPVPTNPPPPEPAPQAAAAPARPEPTPPEPAKPEPVATTPEPATPEPATPEPAKPEPIATTPEPIATTPEPAKPEPPPEPRRVSRRPERPEPSRRSDPPKRVATISADDVKDKADALFRARKFNDAAAALRAQAGNVSTGDASELRNLASTYEQFGRKFNVGMAAQTAPAQAWDLLKSAQSFDSANAFRDEIDTKLGQIAAKAALGFVGAKNFTKALQAVKLAEQAGKTSSTQIVRAKIDDYARELLAEAQGELSSSPREARSKLQQVRALTEPKSALYVKATKLLN